MKNIILLLIGVFACNFSYAQLSADFSCVGVGYDGCCGNGFHDLSSSGTNPITSWYWDFGNGETSSDQHPYCVCYENIGFYTVCLTITGHAVLLPLVYLNLTNQILQYSKIMLLMNFTFKQTLAKNYNLL